MKFKEVPVTIVIPIRNELVTLNSLFKSLAALDPAPAEIIFVDTGSQDGCTAAIANWTEGFGLETHLISSLGGYPGAARNIGIAKASSDWIAFLDAGIEPHHFWLGALWNTRQDSDAEAIFGVCRFVSDEWLGRMLCAISYGVDRQHAVLPASLFHRDLFRRVGMFEEQLRAGEDILWRMTLEKAGIAIAVCDRAIVEYRYFPQTLWQATRKQYIYEQCAALVGIGGGLRVLLLTTHLVLYPAMLFLWTPAFFLMFVYLILRGVVDPVRRSGRWWRSPSQFILMPLVAVCIDFAAILGRLTALIGLSPFYRQRPPRLY